MIQGSDEWLQARVGVVTASNFSKVFTTAGKLSTSREGLINQLIAEKLTNANPRRHLSLLQWNVAMN
jgi:hypothetical protein